LLLVTDENRRLQIGVSFCAKETLGIDFVNRVYSSGFNRRRNYGQLREFHAFCVKIYRRRKIKRTGAPLLR